MTDEYGITRWEVNGLLHREDGPAVERADGGREWFRYGYRHREDGPACEYPDGSTIWFHNGLHHRVNGPAFDCADGTKEWYRHGQLHRADGPAVEWANGNEEWHLYGRQYTKPEWLREIVTRRPLTTHQRELLDALSENWAGAPALLYVTVTHLAE